MKRLVEKFQENWELWVGAIGGLVLILVLLALGMIITPVV